MHVHSLRTCRAQLVTPTSASSRITSVGAQGPEGRRLCYVVFLMKREPTAFCLYINIVEIWDEVVEFPTYITHGLSGSTRG